MTLRRACAFTLLLSFAACQSDGSGPDFDAGGADVRDDVTSAKVDAPPDVPPPDVAVDKPMDVPDAPPDVPPNLSDCGAVERSCGSYPLPAPVIRASAGGSLCTAHGGSPATTTLTATGAFEPDTIFEWRYSGCGCVVGDHQQSLVVANDSAGLYTVRAFQPNTGRWSVSDAFAVSVKRCVANDNTLTCGTTKCRSDGAYCRHTVAGRPEGESTHECWALPEGCNACGCLNLGAAASCSKGEAGIEVTVALP